MIYAKRNVNLFQINKVDQKMCYIRNFLLTLICSDLIKMLAKSLLCNSKTEIFEVIIHVIVIILGLILTGNKYFH